MIFKSVLGDLRVKIPLIFHAGPIMQERKNEPGKYDVISIAPTTSMRMEKLEKEFLAATGVKLIVGKGGMGPKTAEGCKASKAVHTVFPGGCAVLAASRVEEVESVEWLDLGMPEAMWVMRVNQFGPLIVSIDTIGKITNILLLFLPNNWIINYLIPHLPHLKNGITYCIYRFQ